MGEHFYLDKIRIILKDSREELIARLSSAIEIKIGNKIAREHGFMSKIEVSAPSQEFLKLLSEHEASLGPYKISYVEIAKDVICSSKGESLDVFDYIQKRTQKKYTPERFDYDAFENMDEALSKRVEQEDEKEKYGSRTAYRGTKAHKLAIYPRISKVICAPCVHSEWRMFGAGRIKRLAKIESVRDLISFDFESFFQRHTKWHVTFSEINHEKHGRFLNNISSKKHAERMIVKRGNFTYNRAALRISQVFCRGLEIETAADLEEHYRALRKDFKKNAGKKTVWEDKVCKLTRFKLHSFLNKLPFPL